MQKSTCANRCPTSLGPNLRAYQARLEKEEQWKEREKKTEARRPMERKGAKQKLNYKTKGKPIYLPINNLRRGMAVVGNPPNPLVRPLTPYNDII